MTIPASVQLLVATILMLGRTRRLAVLRRRSGGYAAPLNFLNFVRNRRRPFRRGDVPDGFVAHRWADRADATKGRL